MPCRGLRYSVVEGRGRGVEGRLPPESRLYGLSAVLAALALVQAARTTTGAPVRVVQMAVPLVLAGVPAYAGLRIRGQRRRRERSSAAVRAALGLALVGEAVTLTIVASVVLRGAPAPALLFSGVLSLSAGAAVGVPVGYYYEELVVRRRQLEDENERTQRLNQRLQVLNRVLRHNLRNDLSVVLTHADAIRERTEQATVADSAATIEAITRRLVDTGQKARTVEQLLDEDAEPVTVDLADLTRRATSSVDDDTPADVDTDLPDAVPVRALPGLGTAVEELVANAVEHGEPPVAVSVAVGGDWAELRVADAGPGVPEHERRVLGGDETALEHASGVGLWLVTWLVERSGGELSFFEGDRSGVAVRLRRATARRPINIRDLS
jgi:signal transduction histidine kinase